MTRFDISRMVEDIEECLNQMWASPNITGYKQGGCEATRLCGCIRVEFKFCYGCCKLRGYLDASE